MEMLTLLSGLLCFVCVIIVLSPIGRRMDGKQRRLKNIENMDRNEIDNELSKPFADRFLKPMIFSLVRFISHIVPKPKKAKTKSTLERDLKLAGIKLSPGEFSAFRIIAILTCIGLSCLPLAADAIPAAAKLLILLFGVVLAVLIPRYYLQSSIKKRQSGIRNQMPDVLDLLSVSVEAGLGFDAALIRVCDRTVGPLIDELTTVYREMLMGKARREALKDLGERSTVGELKIFASSLAQADQLGISIKNVLSAQSQQLRISRKQRAEEKAMKAPVKMMLPLVVFIFPVIFLILLGPSVVEIIRTFSGNG